METSFYQSLKLKIVLLLDLSKDAIHIHVGLFVFVVFLWIFRKNRALILPCVLALLVAIGLEMLDMKDDLSSMGYWRWEASLHDILNTSFWPVALFLLFKFSPPFKSIWSTKKEPVEQGVDPNA